jgi:hypothetical protein
MDLYTRKKEKKILSELSDWVIQDHRLWKSSSRNLSVKGNQLTFTFRPSGCVFY